LHYRRLFLATVLIAVSDTPDADAVTAVCLGVRIFQCLRNNDATVVPKRRRT
jgi:hypothetical protein